MKCKCSRLSTNNDKNSLLFHEGRANIEEIAYGHKKLINELRIARTKAENDPDKGEPRMDLLDSFRMSLLYYTL